MMLTTACQRESFDAVIVETPDLVEYAPEVQTRALEEMRALGWTKEAGEARVPPCPAAEVIAGCSALRTFVNDYKRTRDQIRAAQ